MFPTKRQLEFLDWEMGVFFHFGIRTFNEGVQDWGGGMPLDTFNPASLDCEQWIKAIKAGGAKYAVMTSKHCDGFANWPTAYSEYSVKNTPWLDGKGDVVKEFTDACRKHDVKVGLYYSPRQIGDEKQDEKEYENYFIAQITELLTGYGKIDYLWLDGIGSENHQYDISRILSEIRRLQPDVLIFEGWDPDTAWVGNEEGIAPLGLNYKGPGGGAAHPWGAPGQWLKNPKFLPFECDCKIRRENWFYSEYDSHLLRSVSDLVGLYYYSIGRGGNLLLNIGPDRRGLLPELDCRRLIEFKEEIDRRFSTPIPATVTRDGDVYHVSLEEPTAVNHIVLSENLKNGQRIFGFEINYFYYVDMLLCEGKAVGHKQICQFPEIYGKDFNIKITKSDGEFELSDVKLFYV